MFLKTVLYFNGPSIEKKLPELKEPEISRNQIYYILITIGCIVSYVLLYYFVTVSDTVVSDTVIDEKLPKMESPESELQKNPSATSEIIEIPAAVPNVTFAPVVNEPKSYSIKIDVSHGFYPDVITINRSDIIFWFDEEDQRARIVLLSKDGLFENKLMQYQDKYKYQFNQQGKFTFNLAEYPSNKEYNNATGNVIVN